MLDGRTIEGFVVGAVIPVLAIFATPIMEGLVSGREIKE